MKKPVLLVLSGLLIVLVNACGGGGGGGSTPGAPDTTAPVISSTTPANSAVDVALNTTVSAVFSEAVTSVDESTFTLKDGAGNPVSASVSYVGVTAVFTPASNLAGSTTYTATITSAVKDAAGNALAANSIWAFTTGSSIDTTPPTVDSTNPAGGQVDVSRATVIDVYFTEAIDCSTVSGATATIHDADNNGVSGVISCDFDMIRFTPASLLNPSTVYTAGVTTGIKDSAGNALAANHSWSFTTLDTPFYVTSVSPANNATGVAQSTVLRVTFNSDIDCTSVANATFTLVDSSSSAVTGTAACSGPHMTFTPAAVLSPNTAYAAAVAPVQDGGGNSSAGLSFSFTTNAAGKMPVIFLGPITNRWVHAIGSDSAGNVLLVYLREQDATHYVVSAQRYNKMTGTWGGHTDLATTDVSFSAPIKLAVNKDGYAVAMWNGYSGDHTYYSYYNPYGATWSSKAYVAGDPGGQSVLSFEPAIDANGNVMAVWSTWENGNNWNFARYYLRSAGTWTDIQNISASDYPHNRDPRFAFDADGNGMLVSWKWRFIWDGSTQVMVSSLSYDAATNTWSDLVDIEENGQYPDIGIDANGRAVAVWVKQFYWDDPSDPPAHYYYGVGAATRAAGGSWNISDAGWDPKGDASNPRVSVTAAGDAMAVWNYSRGAGYFNNINAAILPADAATWSPAGVDVTPQADHYAVWRVVSGDGPGASAYGPQLALDANAKGTLVYSQSDGTRSNVYSMTYTWPIGGAAGGWSATREIDSTYNDAAGAVVTVDGAGVAMTVWNQINPSIGNINDFWFLMQ